MKLLHVIGTVNPAYGGPVEALLQRTLALSELGHHVDTLTLDAPESAGIDRFQGKVHALGPSIGKYRYNSRLVPWLRANSIRYDAVIVCGIWQYQSFAVWRALRATQTPYFVFVHGALDPWFRSTYPVKHLKKYLYWPWAERRVLRDAVGTLFTSEDERILARESFAGYEAQELVVNYGVLKPTENPKQARETFLSTYPELSGKRLLLFLGRLDRKKGVDILVKAFANVAHEHSDIHLIVAGPDESGMRSSLVKLASLLSVSDRITWTGMLSGEMKFGALNASDALVLPSHSENFGIVLVEALSRGIPVLTTKKVNIWREIEQDGGGFVDTDTEHGTIRLLRHWLTLNPIEREAVSNRARVCFLNRFELQKTIASFAKMLEWHATRTGGRPMSKRDSRGSRH